MSWHYLEGVQEASWEGSSLDGAPDALLRLMPTAKTYCSPDNGTESFQDSRYGTMSVPSTVDHGEGTLMSSVLDSLVSTSAVPVYVSQDSDLMVSIRAYGKRLQGLLARFDLKLSLWKTPRTYGPAASLPLSVILPSWGMTLDGECWGLGMSGLRTGETVFGLWPTPTTAGNERSLSMLKWPAHRKMFATLAAHLYGNNKGGAAGRVGKTRESFEREIGGLSLSLREWMMGIPIGFSALAPLATGKFQRWLDSHTGLCQEDSEST